MLAAEDYLGRDERQQESSWRQLLSWAGQHQGNFTELNKENFILKILRTRPCPLSHPPLVVGDRRGPLEETRSTPSQ